MEDMDLEENEENSVVSNFNSDNDEEMSEVEDNPQNINIDIENNIYNTAIYNFNYIFHFMISKNILLPPFNCPICNEKMVLINNNSYLDRKCYRCRKNTPKHDIKYPIRKGTFLENIRIELVTIYFLIFDCFLNNYSANKTFIEFLKFKEIISVGDLSLQNIQKFYRSLRKKIMIKMHHIWSENPLAKEPAEGGVPRVEIDESKIIANHNITFWMFGIIDRRDKACRVYCVKDNLTKESLLPILKKNVMTDDDIKYNNYNSNHEIHEYCISTRVYSDCFASYQK